MAGRTSTSVGVVATLVILGVLTLGFFVAFAVFYGKHSTATRLLQQAQAEQTEIVRPDERNRDDIRNLIEAAKSERKSLVGYLSDSQESIMKRVTGSGRDKISDLNTKLQGVAGADTQAMLAVLSGLSTENANLRTQLQQAEAARQAAMQDRQNEVDRVASIERSHTDTMNSLNSEVQKLRDEVSSYRTGSDAYKKNVDAQLGTVRNEANEAQQRLKDQLTTLTQEKLIVDQQLAALRGLKNQAILRPGDESALVDAEVIGTDSRNAFISVGRAQNVVLGMTFAVYPTANAIRPDGEGNYPTGKATLEVTSVSDTTATARITSEAKGNPVVKGDVVANAVYDPNKKYVFVVYGNFDANRDGAPTSLEREDVNAMVTAWGGRLADELAGDVDFLVLGERPVLPPRPSSEAPFEVVQEFIRRQREVERYDLLYRQAGTTSVPILNENRFYTLTGKTPARVGKVAGR